MSQVYQVNDINGLIQHQLDSMMLVFQKASGITHMVSDPVPAILEVMGSQSLNAANIAKRLAESYDLEQGVDAENIILARLEELYELGLVMRV